MPVPRFVTFTGVDDATDLSALAALTERYHRRVEWGVLFRRWGDTSPKFPGAERLRELEALWRTRTIPLALHLCESATTALVRGSEHDRAVGLPALAPYGRVQLNQAPPMDERELAATCARLGDRPLVLPQADFLPRVHRSVGRVHVLHDPSGGRGVTPAARPPHPRDGSLVGYAGGISPDNVAEVLASIDAPSQERGLLYHIPHLEGGFWIDMQSGVRTGGRLDLAKCEAVLRAVYGEVAALSLDRAASPTSSCPGCGSACAVRASIGVCYECHEVLARHRPWQGEGSRPTNPVRADLDSTDARWGRPQ